MDRRKQDRIKYIVTEICRLLLALTFLFSGFAKGVDPTGGAIKIDEYLAFLGLGVLSPLSLPLSIALCSTEVALGGLLLMGLWKRGTAVATLIFMGVMTPVTLYLALFNPIADCGCFGDALKLTNWETFGKNVVLLAASILLFRWHRLQSTSYRGRIRTPALLLLSAGWIIFIAGNLRHLPLIDFRPYKIGTSLRDLTMVPENAPQEEIEYLFIYEKEGVKQEFDMHSLPDSTWTYIDRKEHIISEGYRPPVMDFAIYSGDREITQTLLLYKSPQIWVITPNWSDTPVKSSNKINALYAWSRSVGIPMYSISGSTPEETGRWSNKTAAAYPLYYCDAVTLKTIARAVPSVLLISDGVIMDKRAVRDLPGAYTDDSYSSLLKALRRTPRPPLLIGRWVTLALWLVWSVVMLIMGIRWEDTEPLPAQHNPDIH